MPDRHRSAPERRPSRFSDQKNSCLVASLLVGTPSRMSTSRLEKPARRKYAQKVNGQIKAR